jgi:hypothetical protein
MPFYIPSGLSRTSPHQLSDSDVYPSTSISLLKGENSQKIHGKNLPESPRKKLSKNLFLPLISANGQQAAYAERIKVTPNPHALFFFFLTNTFSFF